jgi:hypothetical protein
VPISYNLKVGTPDTTPDSPSHTPGVRQGNARSSNEPGIEKIDGRLKITARRSTSIDPQRRNPITPGAPNLPPP